MTKRNRTVRSGQPRVIEIATKRYLTLAITIAFLLSVILTVIQIVSLTKHTSRIADTGARQLEQQLELRLQNIQSNASMIRANKDTAKLSQPVSPTDDALRSIDYMAKLNTIKLTDETLADIWVINMDNGLVYTASRTRYEINTPAIHNIIVVTPEEAWAEGIITAQVEGYPGQDTSKLCLIYRQRLEVSDVGFRGVVCFLVDCKKLYASLLVHNDGLDDLIILSAQGNVVCQRTMAPPLLPKNVASSLLQADPDEETFLHWRDGEQLCSAYRGRHFQFAVWVPGGLVIIAAIRQMVYALIVLAVFIVVIIISFRMIARQMNRPIAELQATLERQVQAQKIQNDTAKDATTVLARVSEQWHAIDSLSDVRQMDTKLYEAVSANQLTENMLIHLSSFDHYVFLLCDVDEPNQRIVEARKLSPFLDYLLRYSLRELVGEGESAYTIRVNEWSVAAAVSFLAEPTGQDLQTLMDKVAGLMQAFTACSLSIACSTILSGQDHVAEALNEAKQAIRWKLVRGTDSRILYVPAMAQPKTFTFPQARVQSVISAIDEGPEAVHARTQELLTLLLESEAGMDDLEFAVSQLLGMLIQTAFRKGMPINVLFDEPEHSPVRYLSSVDTLEHMLLWLEAKGTQLSRQVIKARQGGSGYTNKFIRYIAGHYAERLMPEDVAAALGISYSYLRKIISTEMGTTFSAYLQSIRMEKMKEFLVTTDISQREIAERVGIGSEQTMYRLFKQYVGCSPGEYRRQLNTERTLSADGADQNEQSDESEE